MATIPKLADTELHNALRWLADRLAWERALVALRNGETKPIPKAA